MAKTTLLSHVRRQRRRWALTQLELAGLLAASESIVSKYETLARLPSLEALIALEIIFGHSARDLFPAIYHEQRRAVLRVAETLLVSLSSRLDKRSRRKSELLRDLITRHALSHEGEF
jgi:transcriptional regulator with XRE-family HTH domain